METAHVNANDKIIQQKIEQRQMQKGSEGKTVKTKKRRAPVFCQQWLATGIGSETHTGFQKSATK